LPYKGHKSVTFTERTVEYLEKDYYTHIVKYRELGLTSFSKYVQALVIRDMKEEDLEKSAKKMKEEAEQVKREKMEKSNAS
jgi:hypothetical protein